MPDREKFGLCYAALAALKHLEYHSSVEPDHSDSNHTIREITRSRLGFINLKERISEGERHYDKSA
jgi:hypothetical protein